MSKIKTITFDLDDTLWEIKPTLIRAELQTFQWLTENAPNITQTFDINKLMQWRMKVHNEHPELTHQISDSRRIAIYEALIKVDYSASQAKELAEQAFELFLKARHDVTLFDDVEPLLESLKPHYQLGVLTNGNANIRKLPISHYFDFSFSAEELNASKPAPDMFRAALEISQTEPAQLIHIGDHLEHDVQGALDVGCHAIWINWDDKNSGDQHITHNPNAHEVNSLADVVETINRIESL